MRQRGKVKSKGAGSPRSARGTPLPKARLTRKIDLAKPQPADCHLFGARVNKLPRFYEFEKMPFEKLNDKVSRRFVYGENTMLCYFLLKKGAVIPEHHHESEQITYIVHGKVKVFSGGKEFTVSKGEVLQIPPNTPHRFEALEDTIDIDVFSPIRQDWLDGTDNYLKHSKPHPGPFIRGV